MSGSVNKVTLIGNLGRDPEARSTQTGTRIINFSMAMSESWRDRASGERKERTEWANIVVFNEGLGKVAEQYLRKGSKVYIEGKLRTRKWTDKDGQDRYTTEVVLENFGGVLVMLGDASSGGGGGSRSRPEDRSETSDFGGQPRKPVDDLDEDIPFATCDPSEEPYLKKRVIA